MRTLFLFLCCSPAGCALNAQKEITIKGNLRSGIEKVYLEFPGFNAKKPYYTDSTTVINGSFHYTLKDTIYKIEPHWVTLYFKDSSGKKNYISYFTKVKEDGGLMANADFVFSYENIEIKPDEQHPPLYDITPTADIKLTRKLGDGELIPVLHSSDMDSAARKDQIKHIHSLIIEHPNSLYLFREVYENRRFLTPKQMELLLSRFDKKLFDLYPLHYNKLLNYIAVRRTIAENGQFKNLSLEDSTGRDLFIVDNNNKLTLVVFWASWCVPCRNEIPLLKTIYSRYQPKGLAVTSVSIDEDKNMWLKAMQQEQMPWKNLIIRNASNKDVYGITSIPLSFLVDEKGAVYEVDARDQDAFQKLIEKLL